MLTLRKCNRNNKIKNRYIITMVNKTKRINKKGYLKSLQKRKSRRRMYGGKLDVKKEMEMNQNLIFRNLKKRLWSKSISTTPRNKRIL